MTDKKQPEIQSMDFETAFKTLQANVNQLESEDLPLETSLALFERGQQLAKRCAELLETAELQVQQLSPPPPQPNEIEE